MQQLLGQEAQHDRIALLQYQVKELDELALGATELPGLEQEHKRLANAEQVIEQALARQLADNLGLWTEDSSVDQSIRMFLLY